MTTVLLGRSGARGISWADSVRANGSIGGVSVGGSTTDAEILRLLRQSVKPEVLYVCGIGDSHMAGSGNNNSAYNKMLTRSGGRFKNCGNFGIGGAQMPAILSVQVPQAIASGARHCFDMSGANDATDAAVSLATMKTRKIAIIDALIEGGMEPIEIGLYARIDTGGSNPTYAAKIVSFNIWLQMYCRSRNIQFIPTFHLLSGVTGAYTSSKFIDTVHLTTPAADEVADEMLRAVLSPRIPPLLSLSDTSADNLSVIANARSYGGTATYSGVGSSAQLGSTSWYATASSAGTYTVAPPDTGEYGNWLQWAVTAGTSVGCNPTGITLAGFGTIGDTIAIGALVKWSDTGQALQATGQVTGATMDNPFLLYHEKGGSVGEYGYYYEERTITAGSSLGITFVGDGTCTLIGIQRAIMVNKTALGL